MRATRRPVDRTPRARVRVAVGLAASLGVCALLALSTNEACAAALGSFATSVGLLAALAALFVIKGWPAHLPASALSTAGGALLVAGGAAWWWRARAADRLAGFASLPGQAGSVVRPGGGIPGQPAAIALPIGLDRDRLLADLRRLFVQLQDAWDGSEIHALTALTTPEMLSELCLELPGRTMCADASRSTEVVTLRAELLGFEALAQADVVSVEFSGLIRETVDGVAVPFRELWMLTRSNGEAAGWRLARHQALL